MFGDFKIENVNSKIVYQNIRILIGNEKLQYIVKQNQNYLQLLSNYLINDKNKILVKKFTDELYKIAIVEMLIKNANYKDELKLKMEDLKKELDFIDDKPKFLEEVTNEKKVYLKRINKIDTALNNKYILQHEFSTKSRELIEKEVILTLKNFAKMLDEERFELLKKIKNCNDIVKPRKYLENRNKISQELERLQDIDLDNPQESSLSILISIQKVFLKLLLEKIGQSETRKEIIDLMYMLRYYKLLLYDKDKKIKDITTLKSSIKKAEEFLLEKAYSFKILHYILEDGILNLEIVKYILNNKIINLETIEIELKLNENNLEVLLYDKEVFESKQIILLESISDELRKKVNKKVKIFT